MANTQINQIVASTAVIQDEDEYVLDSFDNPGYTTKKILGSDLKAVMRAGLLLTDGSTPMAAALPMGANKITGLADGTVATDAAAFGQVVPVTGGIFTGPITITSTVANQLKVAYDASNFATFDVSSSGDLLIKSVTGDSEISIFPERRFNVQMQDDLSAGNFMTVDTLGSGELTDSNGQQSFVYINPEINQGATAAYDGLKVNINETAIGDGSTGDGNNILNLAVGGTSKFKVDRLGNTTGAGTYNGQENVVGITGSITTTASTAVVGVGTLFTTEVEIGDFLLVDSEFQEVIAIADNLNLTVDEAFTAQPIDNSPEVITPSIRLLDSSGDISVLVNGNVARINSALFAASNIYQKDDQFQAWGTIFASNTARVYGSTAGGYVKTKIGATDRLEVNATGIIVGGHLTTAAPSGGTAATWNLGQKSSTTVALDTANYIEVEVDGVAYKLGIVV